MSHLPLIGLRRGKRVVRWGVVLARFAAYVVIVGAGVYLVTWLSDGISGRQDRNDVARLASICGFLAVLFVVYDLRKDLRAPSGDLPDLDRDTDGGPR